MTRITEVKNTTMLTVCLDCGHVFIGDTVGFHFCISQNLTNSDLVGIFAEALDKIR